MGRRMPYSKNKVIKLCFGLLIIGLLYREMRDARQERKGALDNGNELQPKIVTLLLEEPRQREQWTVRGLFDLGVEDPLALVNLLMEEDPLGVSMEDPEEFKCPQSSQHLVSPPDLSDRSTEAAFKEGGGFLYFQHLRKAGGTGFCNLARRNMPKSEVPSYYCMIDHFGALATLPWSEASYLMGEMTKQGCRITANEWDAFPASHLQLPGAVFATSFRDPLDRWYSQYRFEHLEHRDGTKVDSEPQPFGQWYERLSYGSMGDNYYIKTFCGEENNDLEKNAKVMELRTKKQGPHFYWTYEKFRSWKASVNWAQFEAAMTNLRHFNMVLVLEWIASASSKQLIKSVLGWEEEPRQVLPHEQLAPAREAKRSETAKDMLGKEEWEMLAKANVFDLLFYHWARRLHLERLHMCR